MSIHRHFRRAASNAASSAATTATSSGASSSSVSAASKPAAAAAQTASTAAGAKEVASTVAKAQQQAGSFRRFAGTASLFGAGYACHWAQTREETAPQLLACGAVGTWVRFASLSRWIRACFPETAELPRSMLAKVEEAELRFLRGAVASCVEKGIDSAWLRRISLKHICAVVEADPHGLPACGLVPREPDTEAATAAADAGEAPVEPRGSPQPVEGALLALVELLYDNTRMLAANTAADSVASREVADSLTSLATALQALTSCSPTWHKELGADGVACLSITAAHATTWLAAEKRRVSLAISSPWATGLPGDEQGEERQEMPASLQLLPREDEKLIEDSLFATWQALSSLRRPTGKAQQERRSELKRVVRAMAALPLAPPAAATCAPQEFVPDDVRQTMAVAVATQCGGSLWRPFASGFSRSRGAAATDEAGLPVKRTLSGSVGQALEYAAFIGLLSAAVVAASQDGMGLLRFKVLPDHWQAWMASEVLKHGVRVEELMAKYDSSAAVSLTPESPITLGPSS
eukprot:TRINITY_DN74719_c0_g1_i1.p1 TRINITY_DN74719_c0_g1~~TRINITY_DN74719_c0_g1_i1.p1  ORF type:complete len:523 (+),score=118.88 TRINITY_DN74719_c0_g1_i1:78-1646(+)